MIPKRQTSYAVTRKDESEIGIGFLKRCIAHQKVYTLYTLPEDVVLNTPYKRTTAWLATDILYIL